jgi:flagellar hook-associated protein 2
MATISSAGIGSGLDVTSLVSQLVAAERAPAENRYNRKEALLQAELSAYGSLKSSLSSFQGSLSSLKSISTFNSVSTTSSDSTLVSASGTSIASPGNYSLEVTTLAQAQTLVSGDFTTTTDTVGTGTLTFQFGTTSGSTFTQNADKATQTVDISSADNSLQGIRDAVNAADIGVTATIVNDGSNYRLLFTSDDTGAENSLKITVSGDSGGDNVDNSGLSQLAYDPAGSLGAGKNMSQTVEAMDAAFKVNGLDITRSSNTVTGVISGVTLTLKDTTSGSPVSIAVSQNEGAITGAVNTFVSGYNELIDTLDSLSRFNAETGQGSILTGDSIVRSVKSQIRSIISSAVGGTSGAYTSLATIGLTTGSDGKLSLDSAKLQEAIDSDSSAVARLFAATGTPSDSLVNYTSSTNDTQVGTYALNVSQLATQGLYTGSNSGLSLTIDSSNDTFAIKVDGVQSGTITLTQSTYGSESALAAEIQSRINGDSALQEAGVSVTVAYVTDHYELTSARYGSVSKVEFTSVEGTGLGVSVGAGTDGVDVDGTLGGASVTGSGQFLTGTGDASGLKLEILGGATGDRGSVVFSRGIADQIFSLLDSYLGTDNLIDARTNGINSRIDDINDSRETLSRRMASLEARYLKQFTALDALLGQMQATSSYLTSQLAALPGAYKPKSS